MDNLYYSDREPAEGLRPNMKYKELKTLYDYKEFKPTLADRYSPGRAAALNNLVIAWSKIFLTFTSKL